MQADYERQGKNHQRQLNLQKFSKWIVDLRNPKERETALIELARHREDDPDLAILLWHSLFSVQILIQEIMSVYEYISPPTGDISIMIFDPKRQLKKKMKYFCYLDRVTV